MKNFLFALVLVLFPAICNAQTDPHFVYLRAGASSPMLATYNFTFDENKVVWVGTLQDEHQESAYREFQMGLGQILGSTQVFALALHASDGWYLQMVALPSVTKGRFTAQAFVAGYIPLQDGQVHQFLLDPATALVRISPRFSLGGSYTFYKPAGGELKDAVGPTLKLDFPKGSISVDLFHGLRNYRSEARITLQLTF